MDYFYVIFRLPPPSPIDRSFAGFLYWEAMTEWIPFCERWHMLEGAFFGSLIPPAQALLSVHRLSSLASVARVLG